MLNGQNININCTATKIKNQNVLFSLSRLQTIGNSGGSKLIDYLIIQATLSLTAFAHINIYSKQQIENP